MVFKKRSSTRRRKPSTRKAKTARRIRRRPKTPIRLFYNPGKSNCILPREYYTTVSSRFHASLPHASFNAAGLYAACPIFGASVVLPFMSIPASVVWMDAISPLSLNSVGIAQLFNQATYTRCLTYKTTFKIWVNNSITSTNDDMIVAVLPSIDNAALPATITAAMKQPYVKWAEFHPSGDKPNVLTITVDWAKFLGVSKKDFMSDIGQQYSSFITTAGVLTQPLVDMYLDLIFQVLDLGVPSQNVPFSMELIQYCKLYDFTQSIITV